MSSRSSTNFVESDALQTLKQSLQDLKKPPPSPPPNSHFTSEPQMSDKKRVAPVDSAASQSPNDTDDWQKSKCLRIMGPEPAAIVAPPSPTLYEVHPAHRDKVSGPIYSLDGRHIISLPQPPTTPMESQPEGPAAPTQPPPLPPSKRPAADFARAREQILARQALKAASSSPMADLARNATAPPISTAPAPVTMDAARRKYIDLGALI
ncbi:unnamed protein product [Cyclocybe aegerita]|uniref:Uncharacterized protein n=1 Tax=Cyclocybe aegerita TaxID=1973307 RepID=A0A8S0W3U6_CYCAE|nr:unnamed protein product [Cyclocybe aegerita]